MPSEHRDAQSSSSPAPHTDGGNALDTHEHAPVEETPSSAGAGSAPDSGRPRLVKPPSADELVQDALIGWRHTLVELAGGSSLADISLLGDALVELTSAHPSGIAQLFAGRPTRLTNIFRDRDSLPVARKRTRAVAQRAQEQSERFGISPTYLAIGVATWTEVSDGEGDNDVAALARVVTHHDASPPKPSGPTRIFAPVLLRPITITTRQQDDFELSLEPSAEVNPVLARALRSRGALLDPVALARGAFTPAGFDPSTALDRINSLGEAVLPDFTMTDKLLVGTFVHPGQVLVDDLDDLAVGLERHEVVAALAGDEKTREALQVHVPAPRHGDIDPNLERGVGDLDPQARGALDALATGAHMFIDAPIGADTAGVAAAIVAEAAAIGRNVLYVPGHRRSAEELTSRLRQLGLDDIVLDVVPSPNWRSLVSRRLLSAMTLEAPALDVQAIADLRTQLIDTRDHLTRMVEGMHSPRQPWGISAYDALQALARLTSERPAPSTMVRFDGDTLVRVASGLRESISDDLQRIAELNGFTVRPASTPWFNATLATDDEAHLTLHRINELLDTVLPQVMAHIERVSEETGLSAPTTLTQWVEQLDMLDGMRQTLDVFQPMVFERTADDLVAATATKQWRAEHGVEMKRIARRRLVRRAKDMVRPGVRVTDLHGSLVRIQAQRQVWAQHCPGGGWPRLPQGLTDIERTCDDALRLVDLLEPVLVSTPLGGGLRSTPLVDVVDRLRRLRDDSASLVGLPERGALMRRLQNIGLGDLLLDFADRRVDASLMDAELDLAWWASVFEHIIASDPHLAGIDENSFETFARRFRDVDVSHVDSLSYPVRVAAIGQLRRALSSYRTQSEELFGQLIEERLTSVRAAFEEYGDIMRKLRPCVIATPTMIPHLLPAHRTVDLVVLDSVQHVSLPALLSAIGRGRQVVVIGDPRCASGDGVDQLSRVLPHVSLSGDAGRRDPVLTRFLQRHGYEDALVPTPLPSPASALRFEEVYGTGMPDPASGAVLSTSEEVDKVVDLAIAHALDHPSESLAIIAGSSVHADRIRDAIVAQVRANPALGGFFDPRRLEPVVISDLEGVAGLTRDAVIFSLGFGRTPHGRTLHRFGVISEPRGRALLLNALGVSRRRLTMTASFTAKDLDVTRLRTGGARLLGALLDVMTGGPGDPITDDTTAQSGADGGASAGQAEASEHGEEAEAGHDASDSAQLDVPGDEPDRLLVDLAERLWKTGLTVETNYGLEGSDYVPLAVGHPDFPEEFFVAVVIDDRRYAATQSIRVRDRLRLARLQRLGWHVIQVWSVALFLNPEAQAHRIREAVFRLEAERRSHTTPVTGALPVTVDVTAEFADMDDSDVVDVRTGAVAAVQPKAGSGVSARSGVSSQSAGSAVSAATGAHFVVDDNADVPHAPSPEPARPVVSGFSPPEPAEPTLPRPDVPFGLPITAYGDNQLEDLVRWIGSDGVPRSDDELAAAVRSELGVTRRSHRVDTVVANAIRRAYARE